MKHAISAPTEKKIRTQMNNTNTNNVDGKSSKVGTDQGMSKKRKMNTYEA